MLRNKMQAVMNEVNQEVAERAQLIWYIAIALLTRKNLFILGGTGQAKSYVVDRFRRRLTGVKQFKYTLSKGTKNSFSGVWIWGASSPAVFRLRCWRMTLPISICIETQG